MAANFKMTLQRFLVACVCKLTGSHWLMQLFMIRLASPLLVAPYLAEMSCFSKAFSVIVKYEVADLLVNGPLSCYDIAEKTGLSVRGVRFLMRLLSGVGFFREIKTDVYQNTRLSQFLRKDAKDSVWALTRIICEVVDLRDEEFETLLITGQSLPEQRYGVRGFAYLDKFPEKKVIFDRHMQELSKIMLRELCLIYDFSQYRNIIDIGGGDGTVLGHILSGDPSKKGVLFDLPSTLKNSAIPDNDDLAGRVHLIGGDFFTDKLPADGDLYILKLILHDWSDQDCLKILRNLNQCMPSGAKLLIVESVCPHKNSFHLMNFSDYNMLLFSPGGMERRPEEFRDLLARERFYIKNAFFGPGVGALECIAF